MIEWEFFQKRRNVDLSVWIRDLNIETYEQLVDILKSKGVSPPSEAYFQAAYSVAVPKVNVISQAIEKKDEKEKEPPKKSTKRTTRRKRQK